jgi:hypothetical protein
VLFCPLDCVAVTVEREFGVEPGTGEIVRAAFEQVGERSLSPGPAAALQGS